MFNSYLASFSDQIRTANIYRHFKGGYYIVHSVAKTEETGEEVVVYQSLETGQIWTRPVSSFNERVPADKENPTGQFHRFERVVEFENQLHLISTENLVAELEKRNDNPFAGVMSVTDNSKVWRTDYLVGKYVDYFIDSENTVRDFEIETSHFTFKDALKRLEKLGRSDLTIVKKVFMDVDF
ncbi:MAG: DUF1653 domain-containing protein [Spirochaetia bacterium]|nr:DUF1653 domain-containing protein [Spirochaetia bacterium]